MSAEHPTETVLIVEDEDLLRESLTEGLKLRVPGYDYLSFGSAELALEHLEQVDGARPRLVISDIRLPGLSGIDLLLRLRELRADARVVLMSAYGSLVDSVDLHRRGAARFVQKPFGLEDMAAVVRELMDAESPVREPGRLEGISLIDILQVLNANRRNARVLFSSLDGTGALHIRNGDIVDAAAGNSSPLVAALAML
ncbi:MAG: response regulator, partial [Myxococcota bacterium]